MMKLNITGNALHEYFSFIINIKVNKHHKNEIILKRPEILAVMWPADVTFNRGGKLPWVRGYV